MDAAYLHCMSIGGQMSGSCGSAWVEWAWTVWSVQYDVMIQTDSQPDTQTDIVEGESRMKHASIKNDLISSVIQALITKGIMFSQVTDRQTAAQHWCGPTRSVAVRT
jgi:hypothetical protein